MPAPIDPEVRAAIVDAIRAGDRSRAAIAREHGVAAATVGNIAKAAGLTDAFDRSRTAAATEAAKNDNAARRARLEAAFLARAEAELAQCDAGMIVGQFGGKDNVWTERWFDKAPHNVRSTLVSTAQRAVKAAADLASVSADPAEVGKVAVLALVDTLRAQDEPAA